MSIISFLARLWNSIRSLFNKLPPTIKIAVHLGVIITENIKNFVDSPLADVLTEIIPGDTDDKIKQALRTALPILLTNLKLTENCNSSTNQQEITKCAIKALQNLDGEIKNAYLHNLSVLISQLAADGKLSWSDGVCIVEWYYQLRYKHFRSNS
ncbi:hypothetical protein IDJ77_15285 [Mucilaginibacter sp. ZT4R22]|uniref:Uncharacterized protein n=1 Tax=Mucilaginibacter pankratovii TaxID=2772110 RepID=A0ABR7WSL3_9SPHI|nr:hypothetical protein [Mucilaginibacter pankratovii]MBD1365178.1 hypothetical protein [Mucilaginibacter pankratovii]